MTYPDIHLKVTEVSTHQPSKKWPAAQTFPKFRKDIIFSIDAYRWAPQISLVYLIAQPPTSTTPTTPVNPTIH